MDLAKDFSWEVSPRTAELFLAKPSHELDEINLYLSTCLQVDNPDFWRGLRDIPQVTVYTDGSVDDKVSPNLGGYAAILYHESQDNPVCIGGHYIHKSISSTRMEILPVVHVLASLPLDVMVDIRTDSLNTVCFFQQLMTIGYNKLWRSPDWRLWGWLKHLLTRRTAPTTISHVKGHAGIDGNEEADARAKEFRQAATFTWHLDNLCPPNMPYALATRAGTVLTTTPELLVEQGKALHRIRMRERLQSLPHMRGKGWESAPAPVKPPLQIKTVQKSHRIKVHYQILFNALPTMERQNSWYSETYRSATCRSCSAAGGLVESVQHVRSCAQTVGLCISDLNDTLALAISTTVGVGKREFIHWLEACGVPSNWLLDDDVWYGHCAPERVQLACELLGLSIQVARSLIQLTSSHAREWFITKVWRRRNENQLEWERQEGITTRHKKNMRSRQATRQQAERGERPERQQDTMPTMPQLFRMANTKLQQHKTASRL
jgi:ribonuclease HI